MLSSYHFIIFDNIKLGGKEFDYEFNKKKGYDIKTECPHCGASISGTGTVTTWGCDYCSEIFHSKSEVERHEENCVNRPK